MTKKNMHMWTKEEIKLVKDLWDVSSMQQLQDRLGVTSNQLNYIINQMKKAGFKFTKKHKNGTLQIMLKELLQEYN